MLRSDQIQKNQNYDLFFEVNTSWDEKFKQHSLSQSVIWYTDGSKVDGKTGGGSNTWKTAQI